MLAMSDIRMKRSKSKRCFHIFNYKVKQSKVGGGGEKTKIIKTAKGSL